MKKVIGYKTTRMFRINCCMKDADGQRKCDFQISGEGEANEMIRLCKTLLDNGFSISSSEHADRTIPIVECS